MMVDFDNINILRPWHYAPKKPILILRITVVFIIKNMYTNVILYMVDNEFQQTT